MQIRANKRDTAICNVNESCMLSWLEVAIEMQLHIEEKCFLQLEHPSHANKLKRTSSQWLC